MLYSEFGHIRLKIISDSFMFLIHTGWVLAGKTQGLLTNSAVYMCFCGIIPDAPDDGFCDCPEAAKG